MYVKGIFRIGNEEADVYVSDGNILLKCFSHPCKLKLGDVLSSPLKCLDIENIMLAEPSENEVAIKGSYEYNYHIIGKYMGKGIIRVSYIDIFVDEYLIPKDIQRNSLICFDIDRFDIY